MTGRIEDHGLIGDLHTAALVDRDGTIDWLCLPRFDSAACFAALLGEPRNGFWQIAPTGAGRATRRRYRRDTLILEQEWDTPDGSVRLIDFMPPSNGFHDLVRIVEGLSGRVTLHSELRLRFDYGRSVPWVHRTRGTVAGIAGPDAVTLRSDAPTYGRFLATHADTTVEAGQRVSFVLSWHPSHMPPPEPTDPLDELEQTEKFWTDWSSSCTYDGPYREAVMRSLLTLKALTYQPTGGIVAAPTTSLPETLGGVRNWDYRYCWLRDSAFTLDALIRSGYTEEARAWRDWLLRAIGGNPGDLQIMYGVAGERRLPEHELGWLSGYEDSLPVRIGNAAAEQLQVDVYGEIMDTLARGRAHGLPFESDAWSVQEHLLRHLEQRWQEPDEGLWEVRGPRRHFVHSKVMAWVAADRAVQTIQQGIAPGDVDRWRALRASIHADVLKHGYDPVRNTFTQYYGSSTLDASLLQIPLVGFLPPDDPRIVGTVDAVAKELSTDTGLIMRYDPRVEVDGLPGIEGAFLACTFWLVEALYLTGRQERARELYEYLLSLRNDLGLLAEEYDVTNQRMVGNFPQAFSHIPLVTAAYLMSDMPGPATGRA
ncbi:glycoside hydrolase family 15 protein [Actinobacteria bacterium YIM 96077]|uniref:Trehalase n=1 Tax=Phytoactinopolyspora halophila TaxID=1981511 RepID=A0A329QKJ1_9ACTN|nr:glycoside hydrolase family 15 protein [Phytoactinopolyspora halophila]AYY13534.1 glycoside hydrolase family 15 protein [Actinobacteria bacterium YIM 96077]RAW12411.1 glycoside hydrolase family 15 protein [Phytoactinopolyspora halophila]